MGEGIIGRQCASVSKGGRIVGASVSEPHTCGLNENVSIYIYIYICLYVYIFIYMVRAYSVYAFCPICA